MSKPRNQKGIPLDKNALLNQLEEVAQGLDVEIRYEVIKREGLFYPGGLCRLKGKFVAIINSKASTEDKIQILGRALKRFDLSGVYLRPGLREYLDKVPEQKELILEEE